MSAQIWCIARYADQMAESFRDVAIASGADVDLSRLIGLNAPHFDGTIQPMPHTHPKNAHMVIAAMITSADPTIKRSLGRLTRLRIGLNPMASVLSRWWRPCRFLVRTVSSP